MTNNGARLNVGGNRELNIILMVNSSGFSNSYNNGGPVSNALSCLIIMITGFIAHFTFSSVASYTIYNVVGGILYFVINTSVIIVTVSVCWQRTFGGKCMYICILLIGILLLLTLPADLYG